MSVGRRSQADAIVARLTRPTRVALLGHGGAGKTTLLAMLYREASSGRIPGIRLAAADRRTAEYVDEMVGQIESGHASPRFDADQNLRLYRGPAQIDLVIRDYQAADGADGTAGSIEDFVAGCDLAVICIDSEGSPDPAEQRRRESDVESFLKRHTAQPELMGRLRPVALLLTRFDCVLSGTADPNGAPGVESGWPPEFVQSVLNERHAMTPHLLARYAPGSAIFAVSSLGGGPRRATPPLGLRPLGLDGPLIWIADQLEARDRSDMDWLCQQPKTAISVLARCLAVYEERYRRSNGWHHFRDRLKARMRRNRRRAFGLMACAFTGLLGLAGLEVLPARWNRLIEKPRDAASTMPAFNVLDQSHPAVPLSLRIEGARALVPTNPEGPSHEEVQERLDDFAKRADDLAFERARGFSRQFPTRFASRIEHYNDYLKAHREGGFHISEALQAKDEALEEWDRAGYRHAYDHVLAHPDDVTDVARRLREYLADHPDGRHAAEAQRYVDWWEQVAAFREYRVILHRGEVEPNVGKYLAGGGPDLGVVIEVAGTAYGPSSVVRNSFRPIWEHAFSQPIRWRLNDPITIRIIDYDWSATEVFVLHSRPGDPLAIRLLSGTIKPATGGRTNLVFSSDFKMPALTPPE
jgi:hypothetical protein